MKFEILRTIMLNDPRESRIVRKEYEWPNVPRKGELIWTSAFHRDEEVKVLEIEHSLDEKIIRVWLDILHVNSDQKSDLKEMVDLYLLHNWECSFYEL